MTPLNEQSANQDSEQTSQKAWRAFISKQTPEQHQHTQGSWMCELSQWDLLKLSGSDANSFLQGQLSCDINTVKGNQAQLAACINLKGRVIGNFIICHNEQEQAYYLLCPPNSMEAIQQTLRKYAMFSKVSIEVDQDNLALAALSPAQDSTGELEQHCFHVPALKEQLVLAPMETIRRLWQSYTQQQKTFSSSIFELRLIEQALVFINSSLSETFTAQEINLDLVHGISFSKGCYTGQEVVARMHYRGKAKRRVFIATFDHPEKNDSYPKPGEQILDEQDKEQGHLLQIQKSPDSSVFQALISINISLAESYSHQTSESKLHLSISRLHILDIAPPPYPLVLKR